VAGEVDHGEQQVADFLMMFLWGGGLMNFLQFFLDLGEDALSVRPIKASSGSALLELFGAE
jgi:hypothetical protein